MWDVRLIVRALRTIGKFPDFTPDYEHGTYYVRVCEQHCVQLLMMNHWASYVVQIRPAPMQPAVLVRTWVEPCGMMEYSIVMHEESIDRKDIPMYLQAYGQQCRREDCVILQSDRPEGSPPRTTPRVEEPAEPCSVP